jgi:SNF2 family DNA or RNA helicase
MPVELWEHQREALRRASGKKCYALFFEQGCGKTTTAIHLYRQKCIEAGRALRALILCPPIVISNWSRELADSFGEADNDSGGMYSSCELTGHWKRRVEALEFLETLPSPCFAITNYEALLSEPVVAAIKKWNPEVLILDESHKVKDPSSKRTKILTELAKPIEYRFLLTGTPFPNSLGDVFAQFRIMDGGDTFGDSYFRFREEFFVNLNANSRRRISYPDWQPKKGAEEEIQRRMAPLAMRTTKEECLTLPPLVRQYVDVELSGEQRRLYEQLQRHGVARFSDGQVTSADLAITKALRLQQMASGFAQSDEGSTQRFTPNQRAAALSEVIESLPNHAKFIVWAVYRENYVDIRKVLEARGITYVELTGEVPQSARSANIARFCGDADVRALIGNPQAAGIGINLVEAEYSIFYSRGFSLENDLQAEARNHRGGSERHKKVTRIDLVARGTVDEVVLCALKDKKDVQTAVLEHLNRSNEP